MFNRIINNLTLICKPEFNVMGTENLTGSK